MDVFKSRRKLIFKMAHAPVSKESDFDPSANSFLCFDKPYSMKNLLLSPAVSQRYVLSSSFRMLVPSLIFMVGLFFTGNVFGQVTQLVPWTKAYDQASGTGNTYNFAIPAGSNRVLVVGVTGSTTSSGTFSTLTATYGAVALTSATSNMGTSAHAHTALLILKNNAVMDNTSRPLNVTLSGGSQTLVNMTVWYAVFSGVDQTPGTYTTGNGLVNSDDPNLQAQLSAAMSVVANAQAVYLSSIQNTQSASTPAYTLNANWTLGGTNSGNNVEYWKNDVANRAIPGANTTDNAITSILTPNGDIRYAMSALSLPSLPCTPPVVPPIGGGAPLVCIGAMTPPFTNGTAGGVWSTSNNTIATINSVSGVATGVANGTVNVIYTVTDGNGCTGTATKVLNVGIPASAGNINGSTGLCPSAMDIPYSVTNVAGVTYTWSVTGAGNGWAIASGQGTSSITLDAGTVFPQTLSVIPSNACGNAVASTLQINNSGGSITFCTQCNTNCTEPTGDNPDLMGSCADLKIVLILDESSSIGTAFEPDVEAGVTAFVNTLNCTGVQLSIVEFNNQARFVLDTAANMWYRNVDNNVVTAVQAYLTNGTNSMLLNSADYTPGTGTNYTNWQSAMQAVDHIPTPPDLVIFFTDGVPTKVYLTNPPPNFGTDGTICGDNNAPQLAEYENPAKLANKLKCSGVHMFVAGVGDIANNIPIIQEISGTTAYVNGVNDISNSDYATGDFSQLAAGLATFVSELCPFDSDVTAQNVCPGGTNGSITISVPANLVPYNYEYYNSTTNVLLGGANNENTNPLIIGGLAQGNYRIEVEVTLPGSGCTRTEIFFDTITAGAVLVVNSVTDTTNPSCANADGGTATMSITDGLAPFMITLKKGGVTEPGYPIMGYMATMYTAMGLDAGAYTFEVKDVNNCNLDVDPFTINPAMM